MNIVNRKEIFLLIIGDVLAFCLALWVSLLIRYLSFPTREVLSDHFSPFLIIFIFSIIIFYIAGLYERHTIIFKKALPNLLLGAQFINIVIAIILFYFVPIFSITPKTNLFAYIIISSLFLYIWRIFIFKNASLFKKQNVLLIGSGAEMEELINEVNSNGLYQFKISDNINPDAYPDPSILAREIFNKVTENNISFIIIDINHPKTSVISNKLYDLIYAGIVFIDHYRIYEIIFEKTPPSLIKHNWFIEGVSGKIRMNYDYIKRFFDIFFALIFGLVSLIFYPIFIFLIKINDGGTIFYYDERIGLGGKKFNLIKFRSMSVQNGEKIIKPIGIFLRKTRIDELPQLWNVLKGDMSLIGPRPEQVGLTNLYSSEIPFYWIRSIIKPGLSGWAQIKQENHPHHAPNKIATSEKLAYDLFYIKNRSFWLDLKIALQTVTIIFSRKGK